MDIEEIKQTTYQIYDSLYQGDKAYYELWINHIVFTWRWWIVLAMTVVPWIVWVKVRKRNSVHRLLYVHFFVALVSLTLDMIGVSLRLWSYPISVLPLLPCYITFDFSVLPVMTMLFLQFNRKVKPWYKGLLYAFVGSFVYQPFCDWLGLVSHENWPLYFSFPFLFGIYMVSNWLATRSRFDPL